MMTGTGRTSEPEPLWSRVLASTGTATAAAGLTVPASGRATSAASPRAATPLSAGAGVGSGVGGSTGSTRGVAARGSFACSSTTGGVGGDAVSGSAVPLGLLLEGSSLVDPADWEPPPLPSELPCWVGAEPPEVPVLGDCGTQPVEPGVVTGGAVVSGVGAGSTGASVPVSAPNAPAGRAAIAAATAKSPKRRERRNFLTWRFL